MSGDLRAEEVRQGLRCAIYARKSTEEGLSAPFNSLEAQRESAEAYVSSQRHAGWSVVPEPYDDGGYSGANLERPALRKLLVDIEAERVDCVVVYKVDRLSRSLLDFARLMEVFERHGVCLVSVTQPLNTTQSLGRLTLNILLSFAQFEREIIAERTRDKIAAAKRKGKWMGGTPALGYEISAEGKRLAVNAADAKLVAALFAEYLKCKSLDQLLTTAQERGWTNKIWRRAPHGARSAPFTKPVLRRLLRNPVYIGQIRHRDKTYAGEHASLIERASWDKVQQLLREERERLRSANRRGKVRRKQARKHEHRPAAGERVPRIARLMALALKLESMLQKGVVGEHRKLADLARITAPRLTQILNLCNLAPDIQEQILFLDWETARQRAINEKSIRSLSSVLLWSEQRARWMVLISPAQHS